MTALHPVLRTKLCDLLGIDYPILQSGMGGVAGPDLAAEVSNRGGLGILAAALLTADQLRNGIRQIRAKTNRAFGVNLLLSRDLRPPVPAAAVSDRLVQAVQATLNSMRTALGLPTTSARPEQIERLAAWDSDPAFTEQERAVIRYAAEATQQVTVSSATFDELRRFLDTERLLELVLNVAFYNMVVRVLVPLEVDLEPDAHASRYKLE